MFSPAEWGAALDLVADGKEARLAEAARTLIHRGDLDLAFRVVELGLAAHPDSGSLAAARVEVLDRLRAQHQFNPFELIIYTERAGRALAPVETPAAAGADLARD